jgi:SAM-dependent methyltransferase
MAGAASELTLVPCPACGGLRFDVLLRPDDVVAEREWLRRFYSQRVCGDEESLKDHVDFTQAEPTNIVLCTACGTVLRNPQPTPQALRRRYQFDDYGKRTLEQLAESERQFFRDKAEQVSPHLPECPKVVEVGSFVGAFLDAAAERGWEALGVDVGEETSNFTRDRGHTVIRSDLTEAGLERASIDSVAIWNTFDQVSDPAALLDASRKVLKLGGVLILRIPNGLFERGALEARSKERRREAVLLAQAYNNFLTFPYLAGYNVASLERLLHSHGFVIERVYGDTILPLSTPRTKPFAVEEEGRVKEHVMRLSRRIQASMGRCVFPWIDVIARATYNDLVKGPA